MSVDCPHCGQSIELPQPPPPQRALFPAGKVRILSFVLLIVLAASGLFLAERARQPPLAANAAPLPSPPQPVPAEPSADDPLAQAGWRATDLRLEKVTGSTIVHAVGSLVNESERRRFAIRIRLNLFDATDRKIGEADDYVSVIEPKGRWQFAALVVNPNATAAKVAAVEESK